DFTGSELSGNKIRKLEFLLAEAKSSGADTVITCGGAQSNHCRATALAAARCGLQSLLLLRTPDPNDPPDIEGNILLDKLAGAEIVWVTPEEYQNRQRSFEFETERLTNQGNKPYIIPEGGSNALGCWGYVMAIKEIGSDLKAQGIDDFDSTTVLSATGSGGTTAGLTLGNKIFDFGFNVVGVNVCEDAPHFVREISKITENFLKSYPVSIDISKDDINIMDGYVGEGYALAGRKQLEEMYKLAQLEGIILDPVYTGKAFFGMMSELKKNSAAFRKRIVFIHTGGHFGLFPIAKQLETLF
ncbi:MAG: D-cysteine desulfhydrase family protein, partial [Desulfobulbia bacterium]